MKKNAVIHIKGGLGNQLFQFSFAQYLKNQGINVFVNTSNYEKSKRYLNPGVDIRELIFSPKCFNLNELNDFYFNIVNNFNRITKTRIINKPNDDNFKLENIKYINFFDGYWQYPEMFIENKRFLQKAISSEKIIRTGFEQTQGPGSTLLHVRRGDYLNIGEELSNKFYKEALLRATQEINNFHYSIFTDDYNWVLSNPNFKGAKTIYHSSNSKQDTLETFSQMLGFENFIVGNSTFSLVAALLSKSNNKKIFVADPWFRNTGLSLNFKNAIKIKNLK